jgi:hypothetical protein
MAAMMRSLSSCLEATRMWRRTEPASLEKKPSIRLSQEPCLGVNVNAKRPAGCAASQALVSLEMCGMIVEDQLDRGVSRIGGIVDLVHRITNEATTRSLMKNLKQTIQFMASDV